MFLSFHLRSVFTPRFTISDFNFHLPHGSVIAGFWIVSKYLWECCPCGLHSVISRLLAVGSLGFRIVPLLLPGSQITVWHFCGVVCALLFSFAIPIPEVIQCYHLFWYVSYACELISWSPAVLVFGVLFGCLCVFCVVFGFCCLLCCFARWQLNGLCIDPIQFSFVCTLSSWLMLPLH